MSLDEDQLAFRRYCERVPARVLVAVVRDELAHKRHAWAAIAKAVAEERGVSLENLDASSIQV